MQACRGCGQSGGAGSGGQWGGGQTDTDSWPGRENKRKRKMFCSLVGHQAPRLSCLSHQGCQPLARPQLPLSLAIPAGPEAGWPGELGPG